ncbi:DUF998 domain-containing protein [Nonomuraea sp. NPDC050536]|uniref:DUF998 domain-containing protein n=1 Tax=Nonomuraea sp. NPDC050536 TaxID=3364366 RepID=UPI0037C83624
MGLGVAVHRGARWGLVAVYVGAAVIVALDLLRLDQVDPIRRTISEHGLGPEAWVFGLGVGILAAGSALIGLSLARRKLAGPVGTLAMMVWSVGLLVTATFHKHDWSVGPSLSGSIHRTASFAAFLALPIAVLIIAHPWRRIEGRRPAVVAFLFGVVSVAWVVGIATMVYLGARSGTAWWQVMPLGLVERGLAVTELASLTALGVWGARRTPATTAPEPVR